MISVSVLLRDESGYEREIKEQWKPELKDFIVFMWEDGNYGCDCNRSMFLYDLDFDDARPCNSTDPTIKVVMLKIDGVPSYSETEILTSQ